MRKALTGLLASAIVCTFAGRALAHIDVEGSPFLVFELAQSELAAIDLKDGSIADWEALFDPSLLATDFFSDPNVGDGAQYDPNDLDFRIWLGWTRQAQGNHVYLAMQRVDNVLINEYAGGAPGDFWRHDSVEFMLDADHSGGQYGGWTEGTDYTTEEELKLINNAQAQQYLGIAGSPDAIHVGYLGAGTGWVNILPYADGGGGDAGTNPTVSAIEFYVTPFDNLIWNDPAGSVIGTLDPDNIIGFQISVPDFDTAPSAYHAVHTLSGQAETYRYADRFVDGIMVAGEGTTAVEETSWADVKASFAK
jgi:hypothetical protein